MKLREWLVEMGMSSLKINLKFMEMPWVPKNADKEAAWELYVELLTRVTTQHLEPDYGDEKALLESVHKLFDLTRDTIKNHGTECLEFTKIAIVVLNQKIRPFTAKWQKVVARDGFEDPCNCTLFRKELSQLQVELTIYTRMLADIASIEDLTDLEDLS